jgi:hypothetical protein
MGLSVRARMVLLFGLGALCGCSDKPVAADLRLLGTWDSGLVDAGAYRCRDKLTFRDDGTYGDHYLIIQDYPGSSVIVTDEADSGGTYSTENGTFTKSYVAKNGSQQTWSSQYGFPDSDTLEFTVSFSAFCPMQVFKRGVIADDGGTDAATGGAGGGGTGGAGGGTGGAGGASCAAETDSAFCSRLGKNCGEVTDTDTCGTARTVSSCGICTVPKMCSISNVCQ